MSKIRVLVVEDSLTVRQQLRAILERDPEFVVVGEAIDGKQAIEQCATLRPDVVTLDMVLPVMSGLAVAEYIMAHCPTPLLVVSSSFNRGEVFKTYDALAAGAVDVMEKPRGDEAEGEWERRFLAAVRMVSRIRVITHPRAKLQGLSSLESRTRSATLSPRSSPELVVIGASTGGPRALVDVLRKLPPLRVPVLIVIHISEPFGATFAEWLDAQTPHRVALARDDQALAPGLILAPPEQHLVVRDQRVHLTRDPERHSCRPSVDVLFESAAREAGANAVGCLLTGMGRDGATGLLALRNAGARTIAQDEQSCVVFGMPREAILIGAASHVLPLAEIGSTIARWMEGPP